MNTSGYRVYLIGIEQDLAKVIALLVDVQFELGGDSRQKLSDSVTQLDAIIETVRGRVEHYDYAKRSKFFPKAYTETAYRLMGGYDRVSGRGQLRDSDRRPLGDSESIR